MNRHLSASALLVALAASSVSAQVITPTGTSFGALSLATFNGTVVSSGIPNTRVEQAGSLSTVLIGLAATQRYGSPVVTDDGAGVYYAEAGFGTGTASKWNFDFFIGGANDANYDYVLRYDFDPGLATLRSDHGSYGMKSSFVTAVNGTVGAQLSNSENLTFSFLTFTGTNVGIGDQTAPAYPSYDPTVSGDYTFELDQLTAGTTDVQNRVAIRVHVTATPEPATLGLMGMGLLGLVGVARRRRA